MIDDDGRPLSPAERWFCAALVLGFLGLLVGGLGLSAGADNVARAGAWTIFASAVAWLVAQRS